MSYFDPKIYNKKNLSEKDRAEIDFYESHVTAAVNDAEDELIFDAHTESEKEIIRRTVGAIRSSLSISFMELIVSMIDGDDSGKEPEEVEDYEEYMPHFGSGEEDAD